MIEPLLLVSPIGSPPLFTDAGRTTDCGQPTGKQIL
jgi:hypothetical protein